MFFKKKGKMIDLTKNRKDEVIEASMRRADVLKKQFFEPKADDSRKMSERIEELDKKLYQIEQRLEAIERKLGINSNKGLISW